MKLTLPIAGLVFLLGMYYYINYGDAYLENFENNDCPNLLIQKGTKLYLKYTNKAEIPGVNPIEFNNLEEYVEFTEWQRHQKIQCPVLFLKREYDAQNNEVYKKHSDASDILPGIQSVPANINTQNRGNININKKGIDPYSDLLKDASKDNPLYNQNMYASMDPDDQLVGKETPLDKLFYVQTDASVSDNPMDSNWGGVDYTQQVIESGKYEDNEVGINIP
jgi:hypothetical protein